MWCTQLLRWQLCQTTLSFMLPINGVNIVCDACRAQTKHTDRWLSKWWQTLQYPYHLSPSCRASHQSGLVIHKKLVVTIQLILPALIMGAHGFMSLQRETVTKWGQELVTKRNVPKIQYCSHLGRSLEASSNPYVFRVAPVPGWSLCFDMVTSTTHHHLSSERFMIR